MGKVEEAHGTVNNSKTDSNKQVNTAGNNGVYY
jgi:hypothetical protein